MFDVKLLMGTFHIYRRMGQQLRGAILNLHPYVNALLRPRMAGPPQHLSTDNLSFVAGLRGRPIVPAPDLRLKVRRQPKAVASKDKVDEVCTRFSFPIRMSNVYRPFS